MCETSQFQRENKASSLLENELNLHQESVTTILEFL